jgi:catechol 2,3-dioxygenase-like lactoylglutathione lyase family enzyme
MFSHFMIGANDIEASRKFYDAVLSKIGIGPGKVDERGRCFYLNPMIPLIIAKPIDGQSASGANGGTIGFSAESAEAVNAWHAAGVSHGGTSCEDPPGWRTGNGGRTYYAAYLRDPAGNKLCAIHHR